MLETNPKEAFGFPDYYEIPEFSNYAITKGGVVINKQLRSILEGGIHPDGYFNYGLYGDDGIKRTLGRHRLMGFVFKRPEGDIADLVVNHENGIKGDDRLSNLEWTTYQGNAEHAGLMGLTEKCIPISVRDVDTGDITKYSSMIEYARNMGMTKDAIAYRIKIGERRVFPERKQYRNSHSDEPWYVPVNIENELLGNSTSKSVTIRCVVSNQTLVFDQLGRLANALQVSPSTITLWLSQKNQPVLPGLLQMKWTSSSEDWRVVGDPYLELDSYTGKRSVKVTDSNSGEFRMFTSATECAVAMNLKPTALNYRLKSKGCVVFPDGFCYAYYSDTLGLSDSK